MSQDVLVKVPRSGSNNHDELMQINKNLIEPEQIKATERQSLTPRRNSISRIISQHNAEIKIQDLKNQHNQHAAEKQEKAKPGKQNTIKNLKPMSSAQ